MTISLTQARAGSVAMNRMVLPRSSACSMRARSCAGGGTGRFALAGCLELLLGGGQRFLAAPRDDDVRAGARELDRAGEADPRAAPGDPGNLTGEHTEWYRRVLPPAPC